MQIHLLRRNLVLDSGEIEIIASAFESAQTALDISSGDAAKSERLAKIMIEIVRGGERDSQKLTIRAIEGFLH
jgi:hypothetical protein